MAVPAAAVPHATNVWPTPIVVGTSVRVSYAAKRPERMVVHGFDVRVREPVYAAASLAIAIAVTVAFFTVSVRPS